MTDFALTDLPAQPTAVIRGTVAMADLRTFFDSSFGAVVAAIQTQGLTPQGPPFARYLGMPTDTVDVEIGFPVAGFTDTDTVVAGELPACRAVVGTHVGSYEGLHTTWQQMQAWGSQQQLAWGGSFWEIYLTDPRTVAGPEENLTRLIQPLRGW
ncbi:MAG: GyrI-like domain-containing protein [Candidatus Nanopelagicales bacterium]